MGLRAQIVIALAALLVVAFTALAFALSRMAELATASLEREHAIGVARQVVDSLRTHPSDIERWSSDLRRRTESDDVVAVVVADDTGATLLRAGPADAASALEPLAAPHEGDAMRWRAIPSSSAPHVFDVVVPAGQRRAALRIVAGSVTPERAALGQGAIAYLGIFALGILAFAYILLTHLIVRPLDGLARAAGRVATGSRTLNVPASGPREVVELGESVLKMVEALEREQAELERRLAELTTTSRALTDTRDQLVHSEHLASVGKLAAGVAHEVGNPLAALLGMQDLLMDGELDSETQRDFLERMRRETERIHGVVRDLLDYARAGHATADRESCLSVGEVASDVFALTRAQHDLRDAEMQVRGEGEIVPNLAAPRLAQVLMNLVLNAGAEAATRGKTADLEIIVSVSRRGERVQIRVSDNGPGVDPEIADRIFDPFFSTKDVGAGTGLGLAVCRGIVEAAGGTISLDRSAAGGGACFVIELPVSEQANEPAAGHADTLSEKPRD